jgi:tRNA (guanine37-N1)-methyltransferase
LRRRLREKLSATLSTEQLNKVYDSFDIVGDIAIFKTSNDNPANTQAVANQIMTVHKSVKAVFVQTSPVEGDFRVRALRLAAGENRTVTRYKESGCTFGVDVEKCYFSPRLSHERRRIASQVREGETVVNMFAGVGCFSIIIAKTAPQSKVFSIDINPVAYEFMQKNIRVNRVFGRVTSLLGDSKEIILAQLQGVADRVLMPLPELAIEYLPYAVLALKKDGGWIHLYAFEHATGKEDPVEKTKERVAQKLGSVGVACGFGCARVVRSVGPNWYQTVVDIAVSPLPSKF